MKSNELRIGNLLRDKVSKTLLRVTELTEDGIITHVIDRSKYPLEKGWGLEPIPLTEEHLLNFGFEKDGECFFKKFSVQGEFMLFSNKTLVAVANHVNEPFYFTNKTIIGLEYVHQLQNLFFALTKTELTAK